MKKIVKESYEDIEVYLRSSDLVSQIIDKFGSDFYNNPDVVDFVDDQLTEKFNTSSQTYIERVVICKVVGKDIDLVDTDHYVINYNGYYYDYTAQLFNESFDNLISTSALPVVQPVIHSDAQITDKLSTVKGYTILGY